MDKIAHVRGGEQQFGVWNRPECEIYVLVVVNEV